MNLLQIDQFLGNIRVNYSNCYSYIPEVYSKQGEFIQHLLFCWGHGMTHTQHLKWMVKNLGQTPVSFSFTKKFPFLLVVLLSVHVVYTINCHFINIDVESQQHGWVENANNILCCYDVF